MRKFRCFEPLPRGVVRNGHKLEAWPLLTEWNGHLGRKYREPVERPGAAEAIAARRQARGEDPETGVAIPVDAKAQARVSWLVVAVLAALVFVAWLL